MLCVIVENEVYGLCNRGEVSFICLCNSVEPLMLAIIYPHKNYLLRIYTKYW